MPRIEKSQGEIALFPDADVPGAEPVENNERRGTGRGVSPIYLDENNLSGPQKKSNPAYMRTRNRKHIAFGWYGGKFSHLDWLLPLLPPWKKSIFKPL